MARILVGSPARERVNSSTPESEIPVGCSDGMGRDHLGPRLMVISRLLDPDRILSSRSLRYTCLDLWVTFSDCSHFSFSIYIFVIAVVLRAKPHAIRQHFIVEFVHNLYVHGLPWDWIVRIPHPQVAGAHTQCFSFLHTPLNPIINLFLGCIASCCSGELEAYIKEKVRCNINDSQSAYDGHQSLTQFLHLMLNLFEIVMGTGDLHKRSQINIIIELMSMSPTTVGSCSAVCLRASG